MRSFSDQSYSLLRFYRNRIKRIFPALLTVLIFCAGVGWFLFTAVELKQLGKHIAAGAVFLSNIVYMNERGYFDMSSETKPLLHLWSLAVEEQFYIFLPPLLWVLYKAKTNALKILVCISVISFLLAVLVVSDATVRFYSPQTRVWELLLGTIIAWSEHNRAAKPLITGATRENITQQLIARANFFSALGIALIVGSIVLINRQQSNPGVLTFLPTIGAALVIVVGMKGWINRAILSNRLFVAIGLISYPLYLWHWPLLVLTTIVEGARPSVMHRIVALAIAVALSIVTYFAVEKPLRFGSKENIKVTILIAVMIVVGGWGYSVYHEGGYPERTFAQQFKNVSEAIEDWEKDPGLMSVTYQGQAVSANSTKPPEILFIGDSHLEQFLPRVVKLTEQHRFPSAIFVLGAGCPPIANVFEDTLTWCKNTHNRAMAVTEQPGSVKKVVVGGCWNCYFIAETKNTNAVGKVFNYYYQAPGGSRENFRGGQGATFALAELEKMLKNLAANYEVYLLLDNPFGAEFSPQNSIGSRLSFQTSQNLSETVKVDQAQIALNERLKIIAQNAGVETIDQLSALCPQGLCLRLMPDKKPIYKDEHHLRPFFVREQADYFEKKLLK
jgi:peptidoglycan/LPS O-acetylase OafA/YrhL